MYIYRFIYTFVFSFICFFEVQGMDSENRRDPDGPPLARAKKAIENFVNDNRDYSKGHPTIWGPQEPRCTAVFCCDSRYQTQAFDKTPFNDQFEIRVIGNQFLTALGSIEYGVEHLETPLLLFIGHSDCGAIKSAVEGGCYPPNILRKVLTPLVRPDLLHSGNLQKKIKEGVIKNINYQVSIALKYFKEKVEDKKLIIAGSVFDFSNHFGPENNILRFINVNGTEDISLLKDMELFKGLEATIGIDLDYQK